MLHGDLAMYETMAFSVYVGRFQRAMYHGWSAVGVFSRHFVSLSDMSDTSPSI